MHPKDRTWRTRIHTHTHRSLGGAGPALLSDKSLLSGAGVGQGLREPRNMTLAGAAHQGNMRLQARNSLQNSTLAPPT